MCSAIFSARLLSDSRVAFGMTDVGLTDAERRFLAALIEFEVHFLMVGLSAAVLQGADTVTADIDLWFENRDDSGIGEAARRVGGTWIPGHLGMMPPMIGGGALGDRFDVVLTLSGLESFAPSTRPHARSTSMDSCYACCPSIAYSYRNAPPGAAKTSPCYPRWKLRSLLVMHRRKKGRARNRAGADSDSIDVMAATSLRAEHAQLR